jgi:hypothetical protein
VVRALAGLVAVDVLVLLVTGSASLVQGGVGPAGTLARLALLGVLILAGWPWRPRLALWLLLLPTLAQFHLAGGRINGDGVMYYVQVRSLWKDFDLDFTNEYTHYELIQRPDLAVTTKTGLRRSIFAVGPAVVWTPFFALGEGVARAQRLLGLDADLSGYGPAHRNAVALGSLLYGFAAVLLIQDLLRRHFQEPTALAGALLVWATTFLHWYMVQQPTMSHAPSAFMAALALWLWDVQREGRSTWRFFVLGLVLGLAMCVRWQNGVLLVLPGLDLLGRAARALRMVGGRRDLSSWRGVVLAGTALAGGMLIGAFPQMAAWKALYDMWVLPYPPHGTDFVRLDHPFVLQTLFSSRHGLLSWTPVFWAGYLGFLPLLRRRPQVAWPLLVPLLLMTYVNMCSGDWWAGGSFSNRRFDSLLPILAFGFAAAVDVLRTALRRHPQLVLAAVAVPFVAWNLALAEQVRRDLAPRDDTVAFPTLVGRSAQVFAEALGSPTTWPASWLFAWRQGRPPGQYDLLVGRYLFYRQNNLGGRVDLGAAGDDALLGEGWTPPEVHAGAAARRTRGPARIFAPLDVPETLEVRFRAASDAEPVEVHVLVNGRVAGRFLAGPDWEDHGVTVDASLWRRELNDVVLEAATPVWLDRVTLQRAGPRP